MKKETSQINPVQSFAKVCLFCAGWNGYKECRPMVKPLSTCPFCKQNILCEIEKISAGEFLAVVLPEGKDDAAIFASCTISCSAYVVTVTLRYDYDRTAHNRSCHNDCIAPASHN